MRMNEAFLHITHTMSGNFSQYKRLRLHTVTLLHLYWPVGFVGGVMRENFARVLLRDAFHDPTLGPIYPVLSRKLPSIVDIP